jgi:hypothetical protein
MREEQHRKDEGYETSTHRKEQTDPNTDEKKNKKEGIKGPG